MNHTEVSICIAIVVVVFTLLYVTIDERRVTRQKRKRQKGDAE